MRANGLFGGGGKRTEATAGADGFGSNTTVVVTFTKDHDGVLGLEISYSTLASGGDGGGLGNKNELATTVGEGDGDGVTLDGENLASDHAGAR